MSLSYPTSGANGRRWTLGASHLGGYMRRWIFRHPWGTFRVHNILTSDEGRDFHDHPFSFVSIILRGGYIEHVPGCVCSPTLVHAWGPSALPPQSPCRFYGPGSIVRRKATALHRLELAGPAWTFVISSRYFRMWGFQTDVGWVDYKTYHRSFYV